MRFHQFRQSISSARHALARWLTPLAPATAGATSARRPAGPAALRDIRIEDLLGRRQVDLDLGRIHDRLHGRTVLITGAGGSVGSELARQVARFGPATLLLFDRSENDLFWIDTELRQMAPAVRSIAIAGDILDNDRLREVFSTYRPHAVFHAAAYKHVPLMEINCFQAVVNNVFGTCNVASMAQTAGVADFVFISSDKAVKPTNVMGVTKRVAELIILALRPGPTRFVSVRFGNVLGSAGSVVPLFAQQIAARRPVTVTHPDAMRYFMTVGEAVQLVLQASTMGDGGDVFMLDMGEPLKIVDLAHRLIRLYGLEPNRDVDVEFTGLRPGEKLLEELRFDSEGFRPTDHDKIQVLQGPAPEANDIGRWLVTLQDAVDSKSVFRLVSVLKQIVPEYTPSPELLARCETIPFDRRRRSPRTHGALALRLDS